MPDRAPKSGQVEPGCETEKPEPGRPDDCASLFQVGLYSDPAAVPGAGPCDVAGTVVCPHGVVYWTAPVQLEDEP
jgi:hypothetical protein